MKSVYICHPYGGKAHNLILAARWVGWAARQPGVAPMAPWITMCEQGIESELGLEIDKRHVEISDELWVCGPKVCGYKYYNQFINISGGMKIEVQHAIENNVLVKDMREYLEFVK
jgi:hypothetical protein